MKRLILLLVSVIIIYAFVGVVAKTFGNRGTINSMAETFMTHVYNFEFDTARKDIKKIEAKFKGHPFLLFSDLLIDWINYTEGGDKSLFNHKQFARKVKSSRDYTKEWVKKNRYDPNGYLILGGIYGLKGNYELLVHDFIAAYFDGKSAVKYMHKAIELKPDFYDAYFGIGLFEYYTATLPSVVKVLSMFISTGDAQKGFDQIMLVKEKGCFAKQTAALVLIRIHLDEKSPFFDVEKAKQLIKEFKKDHPNYPESNFTIIDKYNL